MITSWRLVIGFLVGWLIFDLLVFYMGMVG